MHALQVHDIVAATMIAVEPKLSSLMQTHVPHRNNCFEVSSRRCGTDVGFTDQATKLLAVTGQPQAKHICLGQPCDWCTA